MKNKFLLFENFDAERKIRSRSAKAESYNANESPEKLMGERFMWFVFVAIFSFTFFIFISKLFNMQIIGDEGYAILAESNQYREDPIYANRGVIKDKNGKVIVRNRPGYQIKLDNRGFLRAGFEVQSSVAQTLNIDQDQLLKSSRSNVEKGVFYSVLFNDVKREGALKLIEQSKSGTIIIVESTPVRHNLYPFETGHFVGYLGRIGLDEQVLYPNYFNEEVVGRLGIEKAYEDILHGVSGLKRVKTDALGNILEEKIVENPIDGKELVTNIDLDLQLRAYELVKEMVEEKQALGGVLIAINPKDGKILSFVSYPGYDVNQFSNGISQKDYNLLLEDIGTPLNNKAIAGLYAPGSTFKIVGASAVLEEGIIDADTEVEGPGQVSIGEFTFKDWKAGGHGNTNVYKALASSVDVYFYKTIGGLAELEGKGLGVERLGFWAHNFGLGQETGIDIDGELEGLVPDDAWKQKVIGEQWYLGNTIHYSIGQGYLLVTPIQVAEYTSAIANNGLIYEPRIVGASEIPKDIGVSPSTITAVKEGMKMACEPALGTGYPFIYPAYPVAVGCKTGTSEFGVKKKDGSHETHAWFTVFAPFEDPEIVVTVLIEGGGEGGSASAPIAKQYLDSYFGF